jgi:hypothetical protein
MLQARPACTGRYIQFVAITMTHCIFFSQITCACGGDPAELKAGNSGRAQNDAPQHKLREHLTPRLHDHQSRLLRLEQQMLRTASTEDCTNYRSIKKNEREAKSSRGRMTAVLGFIKGAYSSLPEINGATLSGAIDVLVIQQEDGSLRSSPWYLRIGKYKVSGGVGALPFRGKSNCIFPAPPVSVQRHVRCLLTSSSSGAPESSGPSDKDHRQRTAHGLRDEAVEHRRRPLL